MNLTCNSSSNNRRRRSSSTTTTTTTVFGGMLRLPLMNMFLLLLVLISCFLPSTQAKVDIDKKCTSGTLYKCPNCNGTYVEDCFDCTGYVSTDQNHKLCFNRKLFNNHDTSTDNHDEHFHYLWNDLVGMVVWFIMAGVATACGVGGGGIYVPLGILLFQFSPKQASGLSQASIFGASLGGLLLNSKNRHPNKYLSDQPGIQDPKHNNANDQHPRTLQSNLDEHGQPIVTNSTNNNNIEEGAVNKSTAGTNTINYYTRPLIHYDMALFLAPMEMAGAVLGVLIQKLLPNWLYLLIAGLVLMFTSYKTYKKYFAVRQKEKHHEEVLASQHNASQHNQSSSNGQQEQEQATAVVSHSMGSGVVVVENGGHDDANDDPNFNDDNHDDGVSVVSLVNNNTTNGEKKNPNALVPEQQTQKQLDDDDDPDQVLRTKYFHEDMRQYPVEKITALIVLWIGLFVLTLLKGGKGVESLIGITCESVWYPILIVCQFLWMFGFAIFFGITLVQKQKKRNVVKYGYLPDDPIWDTASLRFYGIFTFIAGIVAGLIGIGGGMVLGPLMLIMGIHPRVSSATTATMIVLTSSSVAVIFVTSGLVPWSYAVFYFFVCLAGAIVGKSKIDGYVKRTGRASLLIFILASIIAFATIGCFVIMLWRLADKDWCFDGFNAFCKVDSDESCPVDRLLSTLSGDSNNNFADGADGL